MINVFPSSKSAFLIRPFDVVSRPIVSFSKEKNHNNKKQISQ